MKRPWLRLSIGLAITIVVLAFTAYVRMCVVQYETSDRYTCRSPILLVDAMSTVRRFEPSASSILFIADQGTSNKPPAISFKYHLHTATSDYEIDNCQVTMFDRRFPNDLSAFYGRQYKELVLSQNYIPEKRIRQVAKTYVFTHITDIGPLNSVGFVRESDAVGTASSQLKQYAVCFFNNPDALLFSPLRAVVIVEALTGRVVSCVETRCPITISLRPKISADEAMATAIKSLVQHGRAGSIEGLGITDPDAQGQEHLVYVVSFSGIGPPFNSEYSMDYSFQGMVKPIPWWLRCKVAPVKANYRAMVDAMTDRFLAWGFNSEPPPHLALRVRWSVHEEALNDRWDRCDRRDHLRIPYLLLASREKNR